MDNEVWIKVKVFQSKCFDINSGCVVQTMRGYVTSDSEIFNWNYFPDPLLLTWFNFNLSMDK